MELEPRSLSDAQAPAVEDRRVGRNRFVRRIVLPGPVLEALWMGARRAIMGRPTDLLLASGGPRARLHRQAAEAGRRHSGQGKVCFRRCESCPGAIVYSPEGLARHGYRGPCD